MISQPKKCFCEEAGFVDLTESQTVSDFINYPCKEHYRQISDAVLESQAEINKRVPLEYGVEIT